jgi:hypothetical protein
MGPAVTETVALAAMVLKGDLSPLEYGACDGAETFRVRRAGGEGLQQNPLGDSRHTVPAPAQEASDTSPQRADIRTVPAVSLIGGTSINRGQGEGLYDR